MIDLKYHVASLVGVFLALGVGILVGSTMVNDSALVDQQEKIIDRLEADFARLKADREALTSRLAASERALSASLDFEDTIVRGLVAGKLAGRRVAIVVCQDAMSQDGRKSVVRCIEEAGGELVRIIHVKKRLAPVSAREAREVASALGVTAAGAEAVGRTAAEALASYAVLGEVAPVLDALVALGYAASEGGTADPPRRADAVVTVVGSPDPALSPADAGIPMVRAMKSLGAEVVGVEAWGVKVSQVAEYRREGISTVDCADLPLGRLSLVYALSGQRGHFGIKDASVTCIPDIVRR